MKFRKKPVVIDAYKTDEEMFIATLEGDMRAAPGDWVITGINGERYPCKPDIFEKTYDPASEDTWKDRLAAEHEQLADRVDKLQAFMETAAFDTIPPQHAELMDVQLRSMRVYLEALGERIMHYT